MIIAATLFIIIFELPSVIYISIQIHQLLHNHTKIDNDQKLYYFSRICIDTSAALNVLIFFLSGRRYRNKMLNRLSRVFCCREQHNPPGNRLRVVFDWGMDGEAHATIIRQANSTQIVGLGGTGNTCVHLQVDHPQLNRAQTL